MFDYVCDRVLLSYFSYVPISRNGRKDTCFSVCNAMSLVIMNRFCSIQVEALYTQNTHI